MKSSNRASVPKEAIRNMKASLFLKPSTPTTNAITKKEQRPFTVNQKEKKRLALWCRWILPLVYLFILP